ncbi:MAG: hypothetical protein NZ849_04110 [Meiothermus sp.]|uniref:pilus assembly FimT family protein n=1 Tax=Meiothermus sp. TaxID=1955249 RepID=UPI0025F6C1EF|nr:hypothetical protein [Meiothermus sp.]MCS7059505.1 hypothetical protein [Meiothermus sp.]MCS7194083.1 hypothetical protein [Meiothermus sp.]
MRGLSLVEFLAVLLVLGTLLAVGGVGLTAYLQNSRLNQARAELAEALRQVGNRALTESRPYTVRLTLGSSQLSWSNSEGPAGSLTLPHGVRVTSVSPSTTVEYVGRGFPLSQYRIELQLGSRPPRPVVLLPTGKVVTP